MSSCRRTYQSKTYIQAVIDSEFSLDDAASAIEKQKGGRCAGKVIVHCLQNETTSAAGTGSENGSDCGDNGDCDIGGKKRERGHSEEERKSKRSRSQGGLDDDE